MSHKCAPFDHMSAPQVQGVKSYRTCFHHCREIRSSSYRNVPVVESSDVSSFLVPCACTQYAVLTEAIARSSAALEWSFDLLGLPRVPSVDAPVFLTYSLLDYASVIQMSTHLGG